MRLDFLNYDYKRNSRNCSYLSEIFSLIQIPEYGIILGKKKKKKKIFYKKMPKMEIISYKVPSSNCWKYLGDMSPK